MWEYKKIIHFFVLILKEKDLKCHAQLILKLRTENVNTFFKKMTRNSKSTSTPVMVDEGNAEEERNGPGGKAECYGEGRDSSFYAHISKNLGRNGM